MPFVADPPIQIPMPMTKKQRRLCYALECEYELRAALLMTGPTATATMDTRRFGESRDRQIDDCDVRIEAYRHALKATL